MPTIANIYSGITGGDDDRQEAVLILTKTVIAGVAEYVFPAVAGGFSGINLTGIQLAAIKKCIKEVDHKVSVGLVEHFKTANRDFEDAMDKIECEMFQEANDTLRKVIDEAAQAFSIREGLDEEINRVPLASYRELMNCARMLMFSNILVFSFDEDMNTYLPHLAMPKNKKAYLEKKIETLAEACISKKQRVNIKKRQIKHVGLTKSVNLTRKTEVQDRLDRILKIAYPYVSERRGWTDAKQEITLEDETVSIAVNPQFVPLGEDDEIKVAVGVLVDEDGNYNGFVYVWIWKDEDSIYVQHGKKITPQSVDDFEQDIEISVSVELDYGHLVESSQAYYDDEEEDYSATDDDDYLTNEEDCDEEDDEDEDDEEEDED